MTTITLEHVRKTFESDDLGGALITAIHDISFKLHSGEVLAILGPSGCGKSTLLRLVAGLLKPDNGKILYNNLPLENVPPRERGIGMVFQDGALVPHWEAKRSIGFFLELRKREQEVPQRVHEISRITGIGLEKLLGRFPRQLSGGEKQRVSIARALTRDLNVLLFDEPFANLDAKFRVEARVELKRLLHQYPVTTIYVTHDQTEATALASRIAIMRDGHLEQIGTYHQLYTSPINLFVAEFIGTPIINLFKGEVRDSHWYGENFGGYPIRTDLANGTKVTLGIRPEFMQLQQDGVPGVVDIIESHYAERFQHVEVWLGGERWSLSLPLKEMVERGSTIYCNLNADEALYFDTNTGKRIG